ncbi:MAG: GtrA family protein, partial [Parcubacteria group bacterium]|nr:GtrA family protein [Parcubacteria group bacterium]
KKDALLAPSVGFLVAALFLIVVKNLEFKLPFNKNWLLFVFPILSLAGLYALFRISLIWRPFVFQFGKFFVVGGLNTFLDLGILNFFILITNITEGYMFSVFKAVSFIVTVVNSYFWNKLWTFNKREGNFALFFLVVTGSFLINVGIASFLVNIVGAPDGISAKLWDNIAALSSIVFVLTWNFLGMKFIVFKKSIPKISAF